MNQNQNLRKQYVFSELSNLRLHDLKAQKKTMSMKKFQNIPLNNQEVMQLKYNHPKKEQFNQTQNQDSQFYSTHFRIRIGKRRKEKLLSRLSNPKFSSTLPLLDNLSTTQVQQTSNIIRKCSKLKDKILTENRIDKLQRYTDRQFGTLLQQSKWCLAVHCKRS